MDELPITDARDDLADVVNRVAYRGERVVLTRRGRGMAAIVSMDDFELLRRLEDAEDVAGIREALAEPGADIPWETVKAELGL